VNTTVLRVFRSRVDSRWAGGYLSKIPRYQQTLPTKSVCKKSGGRREDWRGSEGWLVLGQVVGGRKADLRLYFGRAGQKGRSHRLAQGQRVRTWTSNNGMNRNYLISRPLIDCLPRNKSSTTMVYFILRFVESKKSIYPGVISLKTHVGVPSTTPLVSIHEIQALSPVSLSQLRPSVLDILAQWCSLSLTPPWRNPSVCYTAILNDSACD